VRDQHTISYKSTSNSERTEVSSWELDLPRSTTHSIFASALPSPTDILRDILRAKPCEVLFQFLSPRCCFGSAMNSNRHSYNHYGVQALSHKWCSLILTLLLSACGNSILAAVVSHRQSSLVSAAQFEIFVRADSDKGVIMWPLLRCNEFVKQSD
jgi:hypothetical protein